MVAALLFSLVFTTAFAASTPGYKESFSVSIPRVEMSKSVTFKTNKAGVYRFASSSVSKLADEIADPSITIKGTDYYADDLDVEEDTREFVLYAQLAAKKTYTISIYNFTDGGSDVHVDVAYKGVFDSFEIVSAPRKLTYSFGTDGFGYDDEFENSYFMPELDLDGLVVDVKYKNGTVERTGINSLRADDLGYRFVVDSVFKDNRKLICTVELGFLNENCDSFNVLVTPPSPTAYFRMYLESLIEFTGYIF